ncbi:Putative cell wall binding repeat-containing protein [Actinomyces denticolens]|uniref:Cell wall binding repeat-containing protein n=1 Tax=Actinomyces denticolens TaxID=52767 RepID=A0ABY1HY07_9ACTO|nr:Putative cell wall binding repeat-containing protein [Actinomyces denticolens]
MLSRRSFGMMSTLPLIALGLASESAASTAPAAARTRPLSLPTDGAPAKVLELTSGDGALSPLARAGLKASPAATSAATSAPAASGAGIGTTGLPLAAADPSSGVDPERDAAILTEPLVVDGFVVAGFTWNGGGLPDGASAYLRVREGGEWSTWHLLEVEGAEGRDSGPSRPVGTEPFVTGGADAVQAALVVDGSQSIPAGLRLHLVPDAPSGTEETVGASGLESVTAPATAVDRAATARQAADAGTVEAPVPVGTGTGGAGAGAALAGLAGAIAVDGLPFAVTPRSAWGASSSSDWEVEYATARHVVVHHTAGTNNYTAAQSMGIIQGIYHYHSVTLGWGDIGYNFLVDKYGTVYEGRLGTLDSAPGTMSVGGHAYGANTGTMGISMMGDYSAVAPTQAQLDRVGRIAGWFLSRGGVTDASGWADFTIRSSEKYVAGQVVSLPRILAHRDVGRTSCPGNVGYSRMDQIRSIAASQMGAPAPSPGWVRAGSAWYYYSDDLELVTGWLELGSTWYYLSPGSGRMATGWMWDGKAWYYLDPSSGAMATGWKKDGGRWYYLHPTGAMLTGWQKVGPDWYYLDPSNGAMATGWRFINGGWYYLAEDWGGMATGWHRIGGSWYYLRPDAGFMVTGTQSIDGTTYRFAPSGAWIA